MENGYIVINKEQELDVLKKLEQKGFKWGMGRQNPTKYFPSNNIRFDGFPYLIIAYENWTIAQTASFEDYLCNVVFDGRKEEKMDKKYLVTQEFMNELIKWRDTRFLDATDDDSCYTSVSINYLSELPCVVNNWRLENGNPIERNNCLIAIIRWLNGEDVFETQKTYKYYVAHTSSPYLYFSMKKWYHSELPKYDSNSSEKKIFDTREEAEKWVIPGYEVVEIDENEL